MQKPGLLVFKQTIFWNQITRADRSYHITFVMRISTKWKLIPQLFYSWHNQNTNSRVYQIFMIWNNFRLTISNCCGVNPACTFIWLISRYWSSSQCILHVFDPLRMNVFWAMPRIFRAYEINAMPWWRKGPGHQQKRHGISYLRASFLKGWFRLCVLYQHEGMISNDDTHIDASFKQISTLWVDPMCLMLYILVTIV